MTSRKRSSDQQDLEDTQAKKSRVNYKSETPSKVDSNGDKYWEISKMRRVTISSFRNRTMVNVREYYEKDGEELPGRKGISLPLDQFSALIKLLPDIEAMVEAQGESLPRPEYPGQGSAGEEKISKEPASPSKQNIEATSDEESDA